jgi:hypothetical protein
MHDQPPTRSARDGNESSFQWEEWMEERDATLSRWDASTKKREGRPQSSFPYTMKCAPCGLHFHPFHRLGSSLPATAAADLTFDLAYLPSDLALRATHFPAYASDFALRATDFAFGFPLRFGFGSPLSRHKWSFLSDDQKRNVSGRLVPTGQKSRTAKIMSTHFVEITGCPIPSLM